MKTVCLTITYLDDIDHSTVEALVDSHADDEGVLMVSATQVTEPYVRIVEQDAPELEEGYCGSKEFHEPHDFYFALGKMRRCHGCYPGD